MGHEGHHHEEKKPLSFFASPLIDHSPHESSGHNYQHTATSESGSDLEQQHKQTAYTGAQPHDPSQPDFANADCSLHDNPAYHRHAEATTSELFYDLFFVANLTTFTSLLEINDSKSLTAYIGFFSLLWLTWYQVSLYDVRFSTDSVFERVAKAIHFGVMVGFAVIGPQWKPGQYIADYKIYKAFGLILMVSRITLFAQYSVTLFYSKKFKKTVLPIGLVMVSTLIAAILYGALTPIFPNIEYDADGVLLETKSNGYIAWYVIGISETILTVAVSCIWRVISFKGTHMVQRMSLLTLIILGEGIIVICKSISKIVKNEYLWTAAVVGQIITAVLIIYFLYMLYFDRLQEEHFGSIKQQIWSFLHFPLHIVLVLVLHGVSLLVIWRQAVESLDVLMTNWTPASLWLDDGTVTNGTLFAQYMSVADKGDVTYGEAFAEYLNLTIYDQVYFLIPKGVDASKEIKIVETSYKNLVEGLDNFIADTANETAHQQWVDGWNEMTAATLKTLFDTFSVSTPKAKNKSVGTKVVPDPDTTIFGYYEVFDLILAYTFVAGGLALLVTTVLGFISLPKHERRVAQYVPLGVNALFGIGLCLVSVIRYSDNNMRAFLGSVWMVPTICLTLFFCVVINHIRLPKRKTH